MSNLGEIREIRKCVDYFYEKTKSDFEADIDPVIIISAIIYQYLQIKYVSKIDSVKSIIDSYQGEIGLIGPGNGKITLFRGTIFSILILSCT